METFAVIKNKQNGKTLFFKNILDNLIQDLKFNIWVNNITFETHYVFIDGFRVDKECFDKHLFTNEEEIKGVSYPRLLEIKQEKLELCLI